jgi:hypothetical protein
VIDYANGWGASPAQALEEAEKVARHAVHLDEHQPYALWALSMAGLWVRRYEEAIRTAEKVICIQSKLRRGSALRGEAFQNWRAATAA